MSERSFLDRFRGNKKETIAGALAGVLSASEAAEAQEKPPAPVVAEHVTEASLDNKGEGKNPKTEEEMLRRYDELSAALGEEKVNVDDEYLRLVEERKALQEKLWKPLTERAEKQQKEAGPQTASPEKRPKAPAAGPDADAIARVREAFDRNIARVKGPDSPTSPEAK